MSLRPAEVSDLAALAQLESACFGANAWSAGQLAEEFDAGRWLLVDDADDGVAGYASTSFVAGEAELLRIAIAPAHRRRGRGRAMLNAVLSAATDRGCSRMLLEVDASNSAAIGLYSAAGFVPVSRRRGYYGSRDAVVMRWSAQ